MMKYDYENKCFICPFCGGNLEEYLGDDVTIQTFTCEDCEREIDSNGEEITDWEEYLKEDYI
ncbi:hypothetical protein [Clostridium culturomicium]|uniref:hypothetical protein n=1 Tax=Clostridium culturomicium TaxID=1499683 RepID=UPI003857BD65